MQLLLASRAWQTPFDPAPWQRLLPNASREGIARGGYLYDRYEGRVEASFESAVERLLSYAIFPPSRMRTVVCSPDARVAAAVTIVQRVRFGCIALESAVRVIERERCSDAASFAYATLDGHPEQGIASFAVERRESAASAESQVHFIAEAWSRPGSRLAQLGRPIARQLQRSITREAVAHFCRSSPHDPPSSELAPL